MIEQIINIGKNLTSYNDESLIKTSLSGHEYCTSQDFSGEYMIGLAFGNEKTPATKSLAITAQNAREYGKRRMPLISQWAILYNMPRTLPSDWSIDSMSRGALGHEAALNSRDVLERARVIVINEYGRDSLNKAIFIAHPAHMQRVIWLAKKLDFKGIPFVESNPIWNTGYENQNAGATASQSAWRGYELKARVHHIAKGWF